jgi:hypothetical protein
MQQLADEAGPRRGETGAPKIQRHAQPLRQGAHAGR